MESSSSALLFSRREQLLGILPAFMLYALLGEAKASSPARTDAVRKWIEDQQEIASALSRGAIGGRQWALEVERLARAIDVEELMTHVGHSQIRLAGGPSHNDPVKRYVRFLDEAGQPRRLAYGVALHAVERHHAARPQAHGFRAPRRGRQAPRAEF